MNNQWTRIVLLLISGLGLMATGCSQPSRFSLSNSNIEWEGQTTGLSARLVGVPADEIDQLRDDELIDMLNDRSRDIAAHVVLSQRHLSENTGHDGYCGLGVDITKDGSVVIDRASRQRLPRMWANRLKSSGVR